MRRSQSSERQEYTESSRARDRGWLGLKWGGSYRRRWGGRRQSNMGKMDCLGVGDPVGGLGAVGDAQERGRGGGWRPTVEVDRV